MLVYAEDEEPWAAFDVTWYEQGKVACGDWVLLALPDGPLVVRAWDAGRFGKHWVETFGPDRPIVADLPEHLRPDGKMSWPVTVVNLSRMGWVP